MGDRDYAAALPTVGSNVAVLKKQGQFKKEEQAEVVFVGRDVVVVAKPGAVEAFDVADIHSNPGAPGVNPPAEEGE